MGKAEQTGADADWELSQDYYQEAEDKHISLKDFLEPEPDLALESAALSLDGDAADEIERVADLVRQVTAMGAKGQSAATVAAALGAKEELVRDIFACLGTFPEDDALAIARLLVLG